MHGMKFGLFSNIYRPFLYATIVGTTASNSVPVLNKLQDKTEVSICLVEVLEDPSLGVVLGDVVQQHAVE